MPSTSTLPLLAQGLDRFQGVAHLGEAIRDVEGRLIDVRVLWINEVARHREASRSVIGGAWSVLYPCVSTSGILAAALRVLAGGGPVRGEVNLEEELAGSRRLEYEGVLVADDVLLWVERDISHVRRALVNLQGLQDMTAALSQALTVRDVVEVVSEITFSMVGVDVGGLALLDVPARRLRFRTLRGLDEASLPWHGGFSVDGENPMSEAFRRNEARYYRNSQELSASWSGAATVAGEARVFLPLCAKRPLGIMALMWNTPREFTEAERLFLSTVAAQCAQAIERAQLFESQVRTAQELQRALLPPQLPQLPGIAAAARYVPATGDAVGGDWYDVLPLPRGGVGLVMGDVEGHSVTAAAIMGQARNVLRAYAAEGHAPGEVLTRVNRFVAQYTDCLITCCYLELRPAEGIVTAVSAGHPPPIVLPEDGRARAVRVETGPPLRVEAAWRYPEQTTVLPARCSVVLYTDGLVEDHARGLHAGVEAILRAAATLAQANPDAMADALVARATGDLSDDAALLVVRLTGGADAGDGTRTASRVFGPTPAATPAARHFVHDVLGGWRLEDLRDTAALLVSELVTNAVLHTASDVRLTLRRTGPERIWIGVQDDSDRLPQRRSPSPDDISGRGLAIISEVADAWGVDPAAGSGGKTVWLELCGAADVTVAGSSRSPRSAGSGSP